jgi:hypothetical protein
MLFFKLPNAEIVMPIRHARLAYVVYLAGLVLALMCAAPSWAQMQAMTEQELSDTRGQGLIDLSNSSYNGFDFTRISFGADVQLNANFNNIRLGEYNYAARNGTGADIDISTLRFGRTDGTLAQRVVNITNPYIEFVYRNAGNAATREVVGMRFGFDSIAGDVGLTINTLSGSMLVDGGAAGVLDSHTDTTGGGKRWDGSCTGTASCLTFSQLGGVHAGDITGASRDFWFSALKTAVQFQAPSGTVQMPDTAQAGFWMNWRDKLTATNVTGTPPPNIALGK